MRQFFAKESVMISMLSILSFISAYLFECGYADAFGFSHVFIEIDLKAMVVSIACLSVAFFPLGMYFFVFFSLALRREKEMRLMALPMILPIPGLIFYYVVGFDSTILRWMFGISFLLGLYTFFRVVIKSRKLGWKQAMSEIAVAEGLKDFEGPRPKGRDPTLLDEVVGFCVVLLILVALGLMVRGIGGGVAHWKTSYQTFMLDGEEVAIIASYGEQIIVGGITEDQFNTKLTIVAKDSDKLVDLKEADLPRFLSETLRFR